jgi:hypothetical protein
MPRDARQRVEGFLSVVTASRDYHVMGLGDIDPASAVLMPMYENIAALCTDNYLAKVSVTLPIFRLFTPRARVGIIAHEFAHAERANRIGKGWHEKMQARYDVEERAANAIARGWGFGNYITAMRREREETVNPTLEGRKQGILRRMHDDSVKNRVRFLEKVTPEERVEIEGRMTSRERAEIEAVRGKMGK